MRKLNTTDVFNFCRLVKATEAREQLRGIVYSVAKQREDGNETPVDLTQVGVDGILAVIEAAVDPKAEAMAYKFLAGPLECTPEAVANMPLEELLPTLQRLVEDNNLTTFFSYASGILGKN